jgi:hypothetical protein
MLGIGIICIIRPVCKGDECNISKPPLEKDFHKYAYRMSSNKCIEFTPEVVKCPESGAIEAFQECSSGIPNEEYRDYFSRRISPINRCE